MFKGLWNSYMQPGDLNQLVVAGESESSDYIESDVGLVCRYLVEFILVVMYLTSLSNIVFGCTFLVG